MRLVDVKKLKDIAEVEFERLYSMVKSRISMNCESRCVCDLCTNVADKPHVASCTRYKGKSMLAISYPT